MKTELTLNEDEIKEAIEAYLVRIKGMTVLKTTLSASQAYDYLDRPSGYSQISCVAEVKSD